mmetsp:Transcript_73369/g.203668  ORF Transcript_73369/g.203668 Transcript_73369/m.203668 type:complete len:709 (+) Transcript_73369:100-2226(+)|eukprot:CAMPEP_0117501870 /NCGR_PEP_ID=MMETSP0784-20121206/23524_1 /TAXON_ID=39447 /ORGANISM="" /LENGTH=708 /DNA_ID=CAMNT_0005297143 /DNA_START=81 /DNA_END=2207 /DNA_ORIENTATION=+
MSNDDDDPREESIKVCCRFRPQNPGEKAQSGKICVEVLESGTTVHLTNSDHTFVYDRVFRWDATQKEVYDYAAKPIINAVLRGFNGTVFAYGQTSSGKTYTMEGPDIEDKVYQGVIPRMVWSIFDGIYHADAHIEFLVKVSIVEIYNERIRDLLDTKKDNLKVHEDKARGVFIEDVTEAYVRCEQEIFDAMRAGHYSRSVAVTNMNEHSSRSHLIFMLTVEQKSLHDRSVKVGKLHLVDLAGSEKVAKTGASGERLDEAKNINRSLSALGNVINALTDKKHTHVPYRDSKLTRVLQESLGGNAKTSLIITCSASSYNEQETISTLRFGQRAKMIKNVVKVNLERSAEELKLLLEKKDLSLIELRARVVALEQLLKANGIVLPDDTNGSAAALAAERAAAAASKTDDSQHSVAELIDQLQDKRAELKENAERISELNRERDEMHRQLRVSEEEKQRLSSKILDVTTERERIEYERNERIHELESVKHEKRALLQEIDDLHKCNQGMMQSMAVADASRDGTASLGPAETIVAGYPQGGGGAGNTAEKADAEDRQKDADRPLKRKVSQLDKNLEQLTVMYHKLVAQNSGLKVEVNENDKKIQRKDQRIVQLEKNLREAKQKYEKLLTQCANLTAAMDVMGRSQTAIPKRSNIVRPVRGGIIQRVDNVAVGEPPSDGIAVGKGTADSSLLGVPHLLSDSPVPNRRIHTRSSA